MNEIDAWRAACDPAELPAIDALRALVAKADPRLNESIKWNAPSFALDGEDRITLGVERKGGVRVVLHRGAAKSVEQLSFADYDGLARWPSPDRGVMTFAGVSDVQRHEAKLADLLCRWVEANR